MFGLGTTELVIIAIVVILLFGAKRIPDLGRSVGLGISNFKKGLKKAEEEDDNEDDDDDEKPKSLEG
ncbi:MAG: twin-arginine translocase TatA/TatE family subunit, partial [Deltaproteobacteria bacterium CG17_big_fil_post_rev_8_21_14_2_50_63_7]